MKMDMIECQKEMLKHTIYCGFDMSYTQIMDWYKDMRQGGAVL